MQFKPGSTARIHAYKIQNRVRKLMMLNEHTKLTQEIKTTLAQ